MNVCLILHDNSPSAAASPSGEDGGVSRISIDDSEWRISHLGFTRLGFFTGGVGLQTLPVFVVVDRY